MRAKVFVGSVCLSLGGWVVGYAEEPTAAGGKPCPYVLLGRPVAVSDEVPSGVVPASYRPDPEQIRVRALGDDGEGSPSAESTEPAPSEFATERRPSKKRPIELVRPASTATASKTPPAVLPPSMTVPIVATAGRQPMAAPPVLIGPPEPPSTRLYGGGEYLLWWTKNGNLPPLATTSTDPNDNGILGRPTTRVLFDDSSQANGARSGARFHGGWVFDPEHGKAIELGGFFLCDRDDSTNFSSATFPLLARPFFSLNQNSEFVELVAKAGLATGNLTVATSESLWGVEANMRCKMCCGECYRVDALVGARYLNLDEGLFIREDIQGGPNVSPPFQNARATIFDEFSTTNQFYGGQVGLGTRLRSGRLSLDLTGKVALGVTHSQIRIDGGQQFVGPGNQTSTFRGGLLALSTNIGQYSRDNFSVVPEVGVSVGYNVTDRLRAYVGYNFLYWTNVMRPGDQIDRGLDRTLIPNFFNPPNIQPTGLGRPAVPFRESDFWAQGLTAGLEFTY